MKVIDAAAIAFVVFVVTAEVEVAAVGLVAMVVNDEPGAECFCWPLALVASVGAAVASVVSYRRLRAWRRR